MDEVRRIERGLATIALILIAAGCLAVLWPFATPLIWAAITAFATWPLFLRLQKALGGRRAAAAGIMTLLAAIVLIAPLILLVATLADSFTALLAQLRIWLDVGPPGPPAWLEHIPVVGRRAFHRWQEIATSSTTFQAALEPHLGWVQVQMLNVAGGLVGGIVLLLLSLLLTFFMYLNGSTLAEHIRNGLGRVVGVRGRHMENIVGNTMRSVVYGVLGTNFIQAVLATLGFVVAGVPGAVLLGLICFFLTLIPFGCNLIWIPIAAWLAVNGEIAWAIGFAIYNIILFGPFETAMRAYIIGRNSEMPLILLLMGMLGGLAVFGLLGLLIGPTLLAVGFALVYEWSSVPKATPAPVSDLVEAPSH